ncbi:hypothetical protein [Ramlibacter humi]|uniref:Uncharacterized protein n=1 Tax=Ramlibacter humi TaxID=2530451 RepID=A0A4Z0BE23_9BURK|nr:hypothetical protein [Ramlibacter humi]TFY97060.1 hypothetical protein EZ216_19560 [Ramlibacter humi]
MKPEHKPAQVLATSAFAAVPNAAPAARKAWAVNFTVPAPQAMPSDRLKARAELVRSALCTGGGGGIY